MKSQRVEEQIRIAEDASSCEIWGLLKRPDEKYVTERAYNNPKFVEDVVRDVAIALNAEARIVAYTVEAENFESIHNHSAYALITTIKRYGLNQPVICGLRPTGEWCITAITGMLPKSCTRSCRCWESLMRW